MGFPSRFLTVDEIERMLSQATSLRDKVLVIVGFNTGLNSVQLLKLTINDVFDGESVRSHLPLNSDAIKILTLWRKELIDQGLSSDSPLLPSREKNRMPVLVNGVSIICKVAKAITHRQADNILKNLAELAGVDTTGVAIGSFRMTYLKNKYLSDELDHSKSISTVKCLSASFSALDGTVKIRRSPREPISDKLRFEVFRRDGFRCKCCGRAAKDGVELAVDHIVPVAKGGKNDLQNFQTLCRACNSGKRTETVDFEEVKAVVPVVTTKPASPLKSNFKQKPIIQSLF